MICHNLVSANRHIIDTSPSLVSAIMQYFGTAKFSNGNARRGLGGVDAADSLQNFAPLGNLIFSTLLEYFYACISIHVSYNFDMDLIF